MLLELQTWQQALQQFFQAGGWVLYLILSLCIVLWMLIVERIWFRWITYPGLKKQALSILPQTRWDWQSQRCDLLLQLQHAMSIIRMLIALCPLVGLLGTVTGMIQVFDALAFHGTGNPRLMAAGVARATLPTMVGMAVAVSGLLFFSRLSSWSQQEQRMLLAERGH